MSLDLTDAQRVALERAALAGDYQLMLGAGASRDSVGPSGANLPGSAELMDMMCGQFEVPVEEQDLLWRVYARAVDAAGDATVYEWLRQQFWGVAPPYWMSVFARSPWAAVWTLNVDDTFEAAYKNVSSDVSRKLLTINWDDDFRFGSELNVIHLHGCVDRPTPRSLVFSLSEYSSSAVSRAAWPLNFRDSYGVAPFVVIGARLRDEPDIEAVIAQRRPTHAAPSFYVSRDISPAAEQDLRTWGLVPVRMSGEDFALEWAEATGLDLESNPTEAVEIGYRVGRQWIELRTNNALQPPDHDLLGGDPPTWDDVRRGIPADLDWIRQGIDECRLLGKGRTPAQAIIFTGRRLTGRSTGLLVLAKGLRDLSWRTFLYEGDGRPDVEALLAFAADGKPLAVLFDGLADVADDVAHLLRRARSLGLDLICVGVDDVDREASIVGRIDSSLLMHRRVASVNRLLTITDSAHLVDALNRAGRLGFLEGEKNDRRRLAHFRGYELFDRMAQLENAPGFGRRVGELVAGLADSTSVQIVLLASLASRTGRTLLAVDAARMTGLESDALVRLVQLDSGLVNLVSTNGEWIRSRQRWMALEHCIKLLGPEVALDFLAEAMRRVAPRLSRASQVERNSTAMLVGAFMSQKNISPLFPKADLDSWYESLRPVFGDWSGRYWEQRAIVARRRGVTDPTLLSKAESFALRASTLVRDAYSLTTFGTVLLAKAAYSPQVDIAAYYGRAVKTFEEASQDAKGNVVGWIAYLRFTLPVLQRAVSQLERVRAADDDQHAGVKLAEEVSQDWLRVFSQLSTVANSSETTKFDLERLRTQYIAIVGDNGSTLTN
jgi:SIR2-like domain